MARSEGAAAPAEHAGSSAARATAPAAAQRAVWIDSGTRPARSRSTRLSDKERVVLAELARGHTTEEIGAALRLSPHTVRTHIKNAMRKLDAKTRAHAVAIALSDGAIELEGA